MSQKATLPHIRTPIPGPRSRELARRLSIVESANITGPNPIFWEEAWGANVRDVDGNVYIDLTAGFGVANAGHANANVVAAIQQQSSKLPHALGDVYPADVKVLLLEKLAAILPAPLSISILANSGAEAVEAALKTALMHTGKPGILAFENSYHGLTYGALAATHRVHFRKPFETQLFADVHFAPFSSIGAVNEIIEQHDIGAILVEPIQGRGGINVPGDDFLPALRDLCDGRQRVLIFDEIYTGMGRAGYWLAAEKWNVVPDLAAIGKGLSGALPISACVGTAAIMRSWPSSQGEAIHTSTFLGNPIACAAALAQIDEIESGDLLLRATKLGERIRACALEWNVEVRGIGLLQGIVTPHALEICAACLREGVLLLAEGPNADVLAITPPAVITDEQLEHALSVIRRSFALY